ncbi:MULTISPECIES: hypothetical protein [Mesotoga]|jgi:hypothetical protein|uniref:hypothetical protein n=1 Tax=Mesotoga TaxID=1184396 RepID=UPI0002CC3708|nr:MULTISPECIES: hypothetical protein [Mesotoga]MCP5456864.1 hypothetical protein [Thermotogota bacterium]CCU86040.1 conserved hypothetical protein [Mesotoga infera]MCP5461041.1 hypothetical protein [Thermotogota bacterium]HNQ70044.1 hypothetical protein [Mesotoga prima]HNS74917.1 hypothetical protein [Mesotoga prima]
MTFSDYINVVLRMIAEGNESHEIYEQLQKLGLREVEITEVYNAVISMITSGSESTEVILDGYYDPRKRVFLDEELKAIISVPGLYKSLLWGDISPGDFERTLSDFSSYS